MRHRGLRLGLLLALILSTSATMVRCSQRTVDQLLRELGVEPTKDNLLKALRSPNPRVRDLAAAKLAEDKAEDAIPAISDAFAREQDPGTRINIAFALAQLGEENGFTALNATCRNADLIPNLRTNAAINLLHLDRETCLNAVLEMLKSDAEGVPRPTLLSILPQFKHASKHESQEIFDLLVKALADPELGVRLSAASALVFLADPGAIPFLETALGTEPSEDVRPVLQRHLEALQKKARATSPK